MTPKDIGNKIAYFRKKVNLSQKDLAKKLNVSNKLVSKWETGLSYPSIEYLNEISSILDVDIKYLISSNEYDEAAITNPSAQKKKGISKTTSYIIAGILSIFVLLGVIALNIFLIAPAIFKPIYAKEYAKELDKTIANSFNSPNMTIEQTISVDGVETKIKEEMWFNEDTKEVRYLNYEDNELTLAIYHDVKYDIENKQRTFLKKTFNNLIDFYDEINNGDSINVNAINKDSIKYIRNEFSTYILTLDYKDFNNAFSDSEMLKNARIKSDIKLKIKTKNKKLSCMQMNFKMSVNNEVVDVVSKLNFSYSNKELAVKLTKAQTYLPWAEIEEFPLENYLGNKLEIIEKLESANSIGYKNCIIYSKSSDIYSYDTISKTTTFIYHADNNVIQFVKIINDNLYYMCNSSVFKLSLLNNTCQNFEILAFDCYVDDNENVYYEDYDHVKLLNSDISLKGEYILGSIDDYLYTYDYGKIIYQYKNNELLNEFDIRTISDESANFEIIDDFIVFRDETASKTHYFLDKNFNVYFKDEYHYNMFCDYQNNELMVTDNYVYTDPYIFYKNYEVPPIMLKNFINLTELDDYYILNCTYKTYKIEKQYLIELITSQTHIY